MVREKQWERVALVGGLFASAGGFFVVAGSDMLCSLWIAWLRYGLFLVIPTVLAFACAARSLLVEPTSSGRWAVRQLQHVGLLAIGVALLCCVKLNWFDLFTNDGQESVWTFQTDSPDRFDQVMSTIRRDLRQRNATQGGQAIITDNHWLQRPLEYLTVSMTNIWVIPYDIWGGTINRGSHQELLTRAIKGGSYVVCNVKSTLDEDVWATFPQESLRRWEIKREGRWAIAIYRLKPAGEMVSAKEGGAKSRR
jgi:hypothetical protein